MSHLLLGSNRTYGNLIEDYNESKTRKRDEMEDDFEGRDPASDRVFVILAWRRWTRNQSLWRITTTKTVERLSEQPKYRVKQQFEALLKKHAIEYTELVKEYENWKTAGNEKNEEFEANEKGWKETLEEIFSLVKELTGKASASGQKKLKRVLKKERKKSRHLKENKSLLPHRCLDTTERVEKCKSLRSNPSMTANRTKKKEGPRRRRKPVNKKIRIWLMKRR